MRQALALFLFIVSLFAGALSLFGQRGYDRYALVMEDPPLARRISSRKELRRAATVDQRRRIEEAQARLRSELEHRKIPVTGAVQTLLNAVFVQASQERLEELRSLAGVRRVAHMPPMKLHLDRAVGLVKAPEAWSALGGIANAGTGVKIGILDTGIAQDHVAFQDPSLPIPSGFPKCVPQDCPYTNNKVIAARSYVSLVAAGFSADPAATSRPDDLTPRDRVGHGTAAAMIVAGMTNTGPSGTITGIAPKAYLGNYKVFGSPGVNDFTFSDVVITALEDALADGMDIVTLFLGSPSLYGPLDTGDTCGEAPGVACDVRAEAVQNAVNMGMTVVVSAGNDGDLGVEFPTLNTIATPGTAPAAITVGASTNSHVFFAAVLVTGGGVPANLQRIDALFGDGPGLSGTLTAPLRDVQTLGNDGRACSVLPNGSLAATIALVERGDCFFSVKVNNAQAAGAIGVVIFDDQDSDFPLLSPAGLSDTGIPAVMIGGVPGQDLKSFLDSNPDHTVTLDPTLAPVDAESDTVAFFSSQGPSTGEFGIKPELTAVGTDIYTATQTFDPNSEMYNPTGYGVFSGTSFSAPMVAGAAALVKQQNPNHTAAQIKSALVNTATNDILDDSGTARVTAVGAGKLNVAEAVWPEVTVDPATLSFGMVGAGSLPISRMLRITNTSTSSLDLNLAVNPRDNDANAQVALSSTNLTLSGGATADLTVRLEGGQPVPGSYEGDITIQGGATTLRVPYLYLVGDGIPHNIFRLQGDGFEGVVGERIPGTFIILKLVDQFGVPVQGVNVLFTAPPGGFIDAADAQTDIFGIAAAVVTLGTRLGEQQFTADAGGLTVEFNGIARLRPSIFANGVGNAASGEAATQAKGVAPGCYISIFGQALSPTTRVFNTPYLPLSLANVSVSFDVPSQGISLPGRIHFVSAGQINVQIPWELEGFNSVRIKVSIGDISSAVFDLPLARNSPAIFHFPPNSGFAAALDEDFNVVTTANPVQRGRVVQLFVNGLGPVDDTPPTGEVTPAQPLPRIKDQITVTIGGLPATVEFSGLAPFIVALYQVNVRVPDGVSPGSQPVIITVNGVASPALNLPVQ